MTAALDVIGAPPSPLLGPTESAYRARALRSWQGVQKEAVRARFSAMHREWCAAWIPERHASPEREEVRLVESDGIEVLASQDIACWSFAAKHAVFPPRTDSSHLDGAQGSAFSEAARAAMCGIARQMFEFDPQAVNRAQESPLIATSVVRAAWIDWLERIGALLEGCRVEPQQARRTSGTSERADHWSGVLRLRWPWCGGIWTLTLPPDAVAAALVGSGAEPKAAPIPLIATAPRQSLGQALDGQLVGLRVLLAGTELNLGQLQDLRLDDVVPLAHALDAPAQLVGTTGSPVCEGWLGQRDGRIAIELVAPQVASAPLATAMQPLSNKQHLKEKTR